MNIQKDNNLKNFNRNYKNLYMKYKQKYINLKKNQLGGTITNFKVCTYNVYGKGDFYSERLDATISEIVKNSPDIICLQEATAEIIEGIKKFLPNYYSITLLQILEKQGNTSQSDLDKVRHGSYLSFLSKWKIKNYDIAVPGNWFDDGIIRVILDTRLSLGYYLHIYNVHTIGGTFNKPPEVVQAKREKRISELKALNKILIEEKSKNNNVIVMGDFNLDSNDLEKYPEGHFLPEYNVANFKDVWSEKRPEGDPGNTESYINNSFRRYLKPGQNREARYDKIIYLTKNKLQAENIKLIGTNEIKTIKDDKGIELTLVPSDHFGLVSEFKNLA